MEHYARELTGTHYTHTWAFIYLIIPTLKVWMINLMIDKHSYINKYHWVCTWQFSLMLHITHQGGYLCICIRVYVCIYVYMYVCLFVCWGICVSWLSRDHGFGDDRPITLISIVPDVDVRLPLLELNTTIPEHSSVVANQGFYRSAGITSLPWVFIRVPSSAHKLTRTWLYIIY